MCAVPADPHDELRRLFGYPGFRTGQAEVVRAALDGRDTLALMPTGAGKSLCYQLPAMMLDGATLVVSPLIALMKDQIDGLPPEVARRTAQINSTLERGEVEERLRQVAAGEVRLVYAAPERLRQQPFLQALRRAGVRLFVVDEAHCALLWGADFRPDYLFIPRALAALDDPPLLALTATATVAMQDELRRVLGRDLNVLSSGLLRENLHLSVQRLGNDEEKLRELVELCQRQPGSGIVYVNSRERTEELSRFLRRKGVLAAPYHAGLSREERSRTQDAFMRDELRVVAATVAFGMGVDKPNVRFIVHYGLPRSLEAYAQESGRAGRDGDPARCVVLYSQSDKNNLARWQRQDLLETDDLRRVYRATRRLVGQPPCWGFPAAEALLSEVNDAQTEPLTEIELRVALSLLERARLLERGFDTPRSGVVEWLAEPNAGSPLAPLMDAVRELLRCSGRIELLDLAERLGIRPDDAERQLLDAEAAELLTWRPGPRGPLVRLLEPPADARERMEALLRRAGRADEAEVRRVVEYAESATCRLRSIAAHFGEPMLGTCGRCDRCDGEASPPEARPPESRLQADPRALADPAEVIRSCLLSLPYGPGKKGLVKVLTASIASPIGPDRCPQYGALAGVAPAAITRVLDQLLTEGYLERADDEFATLRLGARWAGGDVPDVAPLVPKAPPAPKSTSRGRSSSPSSAERRASDAPSNRPKPAAADEVELSPSEQERFERLRTWRTGRARADKMPPYIIFIDSTLREIARIPTLDLEALLQVPGVGPTKVERYGADLLAALQP